MNDLRKSIVAIHLFHVKYRWLFICICICIGAAALWGSAEVFKAFWGLGLEQVLIRMGQFMKDAEDDNQIMK